MQIEVEKIHVKEGRRGINADYVGKLAESIRELGLLNPITVDKDHSLIAGLHRLEAVKMLGFRSVECTISSLEGLQAELAEIDENIVRSDLSAVAYGEILLRRKEIYETLHPETKATYNGGQFKGNQYKNMVADKMTATTKSFVEDTAEKLGVDSRTVRRQIQTARNLTPEAKKIMTGTDAKITKKAAMKISRLEPEQQKEAAALLAAGEIRTVDEYTKMAEESSENKKAESISGQDTAEGKPEKADTTQEKPAAVSSVLYKPPKEPCTSLKDVVAELKDPDKDCSGTPDSFLAEYEAFVKKFHKEIGWYSDPYYHTVFPLFQPGQLAFLKEQTESICNAAEDLYHKVERMMEI